MFNRRLLLLVSILALAFIPKAFCASEDAVDLTNFPAHLETALGISTGGHFAGGILASVIMLSMVTLPIAFASRKAESSLVLILLSGVSTLGFCVAIAWFPVWFFAILVLLIAAMFAAKFTKGV